MDSLVPNVFMRFIMQSVLGFRIGVLLLLNFAILTGVHWCSKRDRCRGKISSHGTWSSGNGTFGFFFGVVRDTLPAVAKLLHCLHEVFNISPSCWLDLHPCRLDTSSGAEKAARMLREQEEPRPYSLLRKQQPYISADAKDSIAKIIGPRFEEDTLTRVKVKKVQLLDLYNRVWIESLLSMQMFQNRVTYASRSKL